jgi:hypothetical protein
LAMEKAMGKIMTAAVETRAAAGTMTNFRWKIAFLRKSTWASFRPVSSPATL